MAKGRILVVEDDFITIKLLQKMLSNNSYDIVNCVTTGLEALEIINNTPVDLILMDIDINGDVDGLDIAKIVKTNYNIPSIFITSQSDQITVDKAIETGAFGFIVKPFTKDELFIAIRIALHRFAAGQKLNQDLTDISMQINDMKNVIITDGLTKTYNSKGYVETSTLVDNKDNLPLGIFTVNINGLRVINENYGIDIGDNILIKMANELMEVCGPNAIIARSGADIGVVFCANDMMALGAIQYLQKTNRKNVYVGGFDALSEAKKAIADDTLQATIDQQADLQGYTGIKYAIQLLNGEKVPEETMLETKLIDKSTLK